MRFSLVTTFCAAMLLAACSSSQEEGAGASGGGAGSGSTTSTASTSEPAPTPLPGPAPGTMEDLTVEVGDRIFFDFDKYNIRPDQRPTVEALAVWLDTNRSVRLTLEGHADERGTREYNLALGERRANAVRDYLVALGTNPGRLSVVSFGEERPAVLGSNEAAWAQNRRSAFVVN